MYSTLHQKNIFTLLIGCFLGFLIATAGSVLADKEAEKLKKAELEREKNFQKWLEEKEKKRNQM